MPQDFKDDIALDAVKYLKVRNSSGVSERAIGIDKDDNPSCKRRPRIIKYEFDRAPQPIAVASIAAAGTKASGAATGTAGDENLLAWPGLHLEYHVLGTQTIVAPTMCATGLDIGSLDQTANDGLELCPGILASNGDTVFTVGTDPAFYVEVRLSIADVSGTDDLAIGFRKREAYQANVDDYDEMAALNVISGDIKIETILNNAATTTTDTTQNFADTETHTLTVKVSAAGVVTYLVDGANPTTTAAFTFDNGEVVVPFVYFLQDTDIAGEVSVKSIEVGYEK